MGDGERRPAGPGRTAAGNGSIDDRVLATTRALVVDEGWDGTSVRAVAQRAGVSRSTVLRRWPSKAHLVLDAVLGPAPDLEPFEGVDASGWIRWVARGSVEIFTRAEVRAAAPGLLAALRDEPDLRDALWQTFTAEPVAIFAEQHPGDDRSEIVLDAKALIVLAAGAALVASALAGPDDTPALRRRIEELLLASQASSTCRTQADAVS